MCSLSPPLGYFGKHTREKGLDVTYKEVLEAIIARDKQDSEREAAPLKPADDAIHFVNDDYGVEESADYIILLMNKYLESRS